MVTANKVQQAIEQIYENEALTSNCMDESSEMLLKWAEQQLQKQEYHQTDPERFDQFLNQLQRTMRTINCLIEKQAELSEPEMIEHLLKLVDQAIVLGSSKEIIPA